MYYFNKTILFLCFLVIFPVSVFAWNDCPYGEVDDHYPGKCGRYADTDKDGICDLSQSAPEDRVEASPSTSPEKHDVLIAQTATADVSTLGEEASEDLISGTELKTKTVMGVAQIYNIDADKYAAALSSFYNTLIKPTTSFQLLHDNYNVKPSEAKELALSIKNGAAVPVSVSKNSTHEQIYHLPQIFLVLAVMYIISKLLLKGKKISLVGHRKFWNILLLVSFLSSGILGILLVYKINSGTVIPLPFNILFWHVEIGIVMFFICLVHIIERWTYFKNILKG